MKIIVIVVTYNGMKWYKNCFDSIRNSSIHTDTIVIDNNSSDGTVQFIKDNYPEIKLIESKVNLGFGKANNIGFRYALEKDADFVFLLNQDAWVRPDTIERLAVKLEENPEYGILSPVHLAGSEKDLDDRFLGYINTGSCPNLISDFLTLGHSKDQIYPVEFVNAALWLISINCIKTVGGFSPVYFHYGEDNDYIGRVSYHGLKNGIYPHVFGIHDRIQKYKVKLSFKQRRTKLYINYLTILTDLHHPFHRWLLYSFSLLLSDSIINILSLKKLLINIYAFVHIIIATPRILRCRKKAANKGLTFLDI